MQRNKLFTVFFIVSMMISFTWSQTGSFKIGSIKYDYNNLELSFSEEPGYGESITLNIGIGIGFYIGSFQNQKKNI